MPYCAECRKMTIVNAAAQIGITDPDYPLCVKCVTKERDYRCNDCNSTYQAKKVFRIPRCPQCKSKNVVAVNPVPVPTEAEIDSIREAAGKFDQARLKFKGEVQECRKLSPTVKIDPTKNFRHFVEYCAWFKGRTYSGFHDYVYLAEDIYGYFSMKGWAPSQTKWLQRPGFIIFCAKRMVVIVHKEIEGVAVHAGLDSPPVGKVAGTAALYFLSGGIGVAVGAGFKAEFAQRLKNFLSFVDERVQANLGQIATQASTTPGQIQDDIPSQIKKLAELKDAGVLTEEEFSTKKQQLLDRI